MKEVILEGLAKHIEEATIQTWFFEEGDMVHEGDDLLELSTEEGTVTIPASATGLLAEVYYDEGETVAKGETLCTIDDDEAAAKDEDDEEDDEDEEAADGEEDEEDEDEEDLDADEEEDEEAEEEDEEKE